MKKALLVRNTITLVLLVMLLVNFFTVNKPALSIAVAIMLIIDAATMFRTVRYIRDQQSESET